MNIIYSHTTALEILRLPEMREALARGSRSFTSVPERAPQNCDLDEAKERLPILAGLTEPVHVIVDNRSARANNEHLNCHLWSGEHPNGSVIELDYGIYCASPEQLIVQMAQALEPLQLIVLISEMFSLYTIASHQRALVQRDLPATTPERLADYLRRLGPVRGSAKARKAAGLAAVCSGSPQETRAALMLSMPPRLGGHGLLVEALNQPMLVDAIGEQNKRYRKPDIMLVSHKGSDHVAIEYDGALHLTPERQALDAARTNELTAAGIPEYRLNKTLMADFEYMEDLAARIRKDLGEDPPHVNKQKARSQRIARQELHSELKAMDFASFRFAMSAEEKPILPPLSEMARN